MLKDDVLDVTALTNIAGITTAQKHRSSHCSEFRIQLSDWFEMYSCCSRCENHSHKLLKCRTFNYVGCQHVIELGVLTSTDVSPVLMLFLVTASNEKHDR